MERKVVVAVKGCPAPLTQLVHNSVRLIIDVLCDVLPDARIKAEELQILAEIVCYQTCTSVDRTLAAMISYAYAHSCGVTVMKMEWITQVEKRWKLEQILTSVSLEKKQKNSAYASYPVTK